MQPPGGGHIQLRRFEGDRNDRVTGRWADAGVIPTPRHGPGGQIQVAQVATTGQRQESADRGEHRGDGSQEAADLGLVDRLGAQPIEEGRLEDRGGIVHGALGDHGTDGEPLPCRQAFLSGPVGAVGDSESVALGGAPHLADVAPRVLHPFGDFHADRDVVQRRLPAGAHDVPIELVIFVLTAQRTFERVGDHVGGGVRVDGGFGVTDAQGGGLHPASQLAPRLFGELVGSIRALHGEVRVAVDDVLGPVVLLGLSADEFAQDATAARVITEAPHDGLGRVDGSVLVDRVLDVERIDRIPRCVRREHMHGGSDQAQAEQPHHHHVSRKTSRTPGTSPDRRGKGHSHHTFFSNRSGVTPLARGGEQIRPNLTFHRTSVDADPICLEPLETGPASPHDHAQELRPRSSASSPELTISSGSTRCPACRAAYAGAISSSTALTRS